MKYRSLPRKDLLNHERKYKIFRWFLFIVSVLVLISCDDKTGVEPEPLPNEPPVIDRVILPNQVEANTPLKLQVIARDADKDYLTIVWEVSEGTIAGDVWTPPDRATQVVISVHVTDGTNPAAIQSKNVTVLKQETAEPPPIVQPPVVQEPLLPPQPEPELPREPEVVEAWNIIGRVGIEHVAPGQEPLKVSIGDTIEQVNAIALRAEWRGDDGQLLFHPRFGEFHCLYKNGKVATITTDQARFRTPEGIGVGSHINTVKAKYGEPDLVDQGVQFTSHLYFGHGYLFSTRGNDLVLIITVRG